LARSVVVWVEPVKLYGSFQEPEWGGIPTYPVILWHEIFRQVIPPETGVPVERVPWQFWQVKKLSNVPPGGNLAFLPWAISHVVMS